MRSTPKFIVAAAASLLAFGSAQAVVSSTPASDWGLDPGAFGGAFDGVAKLLYKSRGVSYVCSGSLLAGGRHVLTAAHCADDFSSMTADFQLGSVTATVVGATVHPGWSGVLGNGSDIAVVELDRAIAGIAGFKVSTTNDVGKDVLLAGYGLVGTGTTGAGSFDRYPWRPHYGYNTIDMTDFELTEGVFGPGAGDRSHGETYVYDFDDGTAAHNALQRLKLAHGATWADSGTGLGANEALIAGGDSGGGDFVWDGSEWRVTGVHSYGWGLCGDLPGCDVMPGTNSSFGDLSGSTATFSHIGFINRAVAGVPEPETWALMLAGLAAVGGAARGRRRSAA